MGTLELLEASPAPLMVILGGKMLSSLAVSLVSLVFSYAVVAGLTGHSFTVAQPGAFAVCLLLALVSMWSMGMLFAPVSIFWPPVQGFLLPPSLEQGTPVAPPKPRAPMS